MAGLAVRVGSSSSSIAHFRAYAAAYRTATVSLYLE
jgi:hypothetical protein